KTGTASLEDAFVKLLPGGDGRNHRKTPVIPPRQADGEEPAIVAKGLTRRFGDFTAVSDVSFEIERGEIFGFLGSNGCGKTTTMKMLTGLLPASEGEAYLFGKPVDANDLETRKRVGFMSQSFSLYGELSVRQNLALHARLFHLDPAKINDRIDALVDRFGLEDHLNATASDLPLGIRQRLSLAVAIIHEPEMLILDEPTSGVDPVARDEFWDILVELSRNEKVTIFLSTHFMTEAMRCDRISLMHAGEVLVYDTPENLAKANGATSLEDSFIAYIAEASKDEPIADVSEPEASTAAMAAEESEQKKRARKHAMRFSLTRLLAYSYREMKEVLRDPVRLAFSFVGSTLLLIVIAYGISYDVEDLTFAAYDLDQTPQSRNYIAQISGSRYFVEAPEVESLRNLEDRMRANDVTMVVEIPPDFGRSLLKGQPTTVSATIDGANTMRAGTIEGYVVGGHVSYLDNLARTNGIDPEGVEFVEIEPRYAFNPSFESIYAIGPGSPAILLLLFPSILMAVSLAREKEIGTITNFYVTPTGRFEYLLGKQLPYIGIGVVNFLILTLVVIVLLQVPLKGSFIGLFIGAVGYVAASTGFGILVSTMTRSQVAAVFATTILAMMPTMQFSGFIQPVSTLEGAGRIMGSLWPTTYYMHLSVGAFTKGLGLPELSLDILALFLFWPAFVIFAACFVNKQEK
ncbi:MAG: ABC transporter permease, partial [Pseudomonadota bacterium]